jgi:hypothetical protein
MRYSKQGLTMLELVVAFGVFFMACSFLMGTFAFGARLPLHVQKKAESTAIAQELLDAKLAQPLSTAIPDEPRTPVPGHPGYESETKSTPAPWDVRVSIITMTVYPPEGSPFSLQSVRTPNPVMTAEDLITEAYGCTSCHTANGRPDVGEGVGGPVWSEATLSADAADAGFTGPDAVEDYIRESVRDPERYQTPGFTAEMQGYPNITDMSEEDLDALVTFLTSLN